jgi:hypothetical protein
LLSRRCSTPQSISILKLFDPTACFTKKKSPSSPRYIRIDTVPPPVGEAPPCDAEGLAELPTRDFEALGDGAGSETVFFFPRAVDRVFFAAVLADVPAFFCAVPVNFRLAVRALFATFILYWPLCVTANGSRAP